MKKLMAYSLMAAMVVGFAPGSSRAAKSGAKVALAAGPTVPAAKGRLTLAVKGTSDGRLVVRIQHLLLDTRYDLLV